MGHVEDGVGVDPSHIQHVVHVDHGPPVNSSPDRVGLAHFVHYINACFGFVVVELHVALSLAIR